MSWPGRRSAGRRAHGLPRASRWPSTSARPPRSTARSRAWVAAGGTIARAAAPTDWGGYSGYVADPDGHLWEFAHNPFWPLDERGMPTLPE